MASSVWTSAAWPAKVSERRTKPLPSSTSQSDERTIAAFFLGAPARRLGVGGGSALKVGVRQIVKRDRGLTPKQIAHARQTPRCTLMWGI